MPEPDRLPEHIRAMAHRQAWRLAPGGVLDATIPMLAGRLADLVPELAERRRAPSAAQPASDPAARAAASGDDGQRAEAALLSRTLDDVNHYGDW